ncbi:MFS transporter [Alkalihalobacillus sp. MEB130]|uniref:MFS transporter n=1 Tax=Alkalihalobacillus sp. MEB130 TaxID=2976704 RepID=UPI0028DD5CCA|nr:MFS transporter [Alkalihalobacillus sp. MEB130]MDT8861816.1 MFS transporter [Alkalihalobacillus sp. MEB130]
MIRNIENAVVEPVSNEPNEKLKAKEKFSYGAGNLAANLLLTTANAFIIFFYTEIAGIAVATVGTMLFIARFIDGASDIGMGLVVDKTKSKYGKARPWLRWLAIPYGLAIILLFSSPNFGETGTIIYAFLTYMFAVGIIFTAISVPYNTMIGTMSQNQAERGQLSVFRTIFGFGGALLVNMITIPLVEMFGGGQSGWQMVAIVYAIAGVFLYFICFKNTKERVVATSQATRTDGVLIKEGFKSLVKNKYWLIVIAIMILGFINAGLGAVNIYYAQYILGNPALVGVIGMASFLPIIVTTIFIAPFLKKFGNRNVAIVGAILSIIGSLIIALNPANIVFVLTGLIIRGIGAAPLVVVGFAMLGDTVDYGEYKHGVRSEGLTFSAGTFGEKVGTGIGGMLLGLIMGAGGYIGGQAEQTQSALFSIEFLFIYLPVIFAFITILLLWFYKLDKEYPQILKALQERKANLT